MVRVIRLLYPRWLIRHVGVIALCIAFALLGRWQWNESQAPGGDLQNFLYAWQWWLFAVLAVGGWIKLMRDEVHPPVFDSDLIDYPQDDDEYSEYSDDYDTNLEYEEVGDGEGSGDWEDGEDWGGTESVTESQVPTAAAPAVHPPDQAVGWDDGDEVPDLVAAGAPEPARYRSPVTRKAQRVPVSARSARMRPGYRPDAAVAQIVEDDDSELAAYNAYLRWLNDHPKR